MKNFKIQDGGHPPFKNRFWPYFRNQLSDINEISHRYWGNRIAWPQRPRDMNSNFRKFKKVDGRHIANRKITIS